MQVVLDCSRISRAPRMARSSHRLPQSETKDARAKNGGIGGASMRMCVKCENEIQEGEACAELNEVNYHIQCIIEHLLERIADLEQELKGKEAK